jgi:DNA-binding CsgD family transcriptional regulator
VEERGAILRSGAVSALGTTAMGTVAREAGLGDMIPGSVLVVDLDEPQGTAEGDANAGVPPTVVHPEKAAPARPDVGGSDAGDMSPPRGPRPPDDDGGSEDDDNPEEWSSQPGEGERVVALAQDYFIRFSQTVPRLVDELERSPSVEQHPDFIGRDAGLIGAASFSVGTNDGGDKGYAVRVFRPGEASLQSGIAEATLMDPSRLVSGGGTEMYGIGERVVAYDPRTDLVVTQYLKDPSADTGEGGTVLNPHKAAYLIRATGTNMPGLYHMTATRYPTPFPLSPRAERLIVQRARDIVDVPYGQDLTLSDAERTILRGIIEGVEVEDIAASIGLASRTLNTRIANLRARFGATTRASLIYSVYVHGIDVGARTLIPPRSARLTSTESLHLYLAMTGWAQAEAAQELERAPDVVNTHRSRILEAFGAEGFGSGRDDTGMIQIIVAGFANGLLVPLPPEQERGYIDPRKAPYIAQTYPTNMPLLGNELRGLHAQESLSAEAQKEIRERARKLVETPYGRSLNLSPEELMVLRGFAAGYNRAEMMEQLSRDGINRRRFNVLVNSLHDRFGTTDQASLVYNALAHGVDLQVDVGDLSAAPELGQGERLQLYLSAIDFTVADAARLANRSEGAVSNHLARVRQKFGNVTTARAVALAFAHGYFTPYIRVR